VAGGGQLGNSQVSVTAADDDDGVTVNVPQSALISLQLLVPVAFTDTLYVPSVGLDQVGARVQVRLLLTVVDVLDVPLLPLHFTVGWVTAVPTVTVAGDMGPQASVYVVAAFTVIVPLQVAAAAVLQFPEVVDTFTLLYTPAVGLLQVGAPVQVKPVVTVDDELLLPLQVTVGAVIAVPAVDVPDTLAQESVYDTASTVIVPAQSAVWLLPPQLAVAFTPVIVFAVAIALVISVGAQVIPLVTSVDPQVTLGRVGIAPVRIDCVTLAHVSFLFTVKVPLQVAVWFLQSPAVAIALMLV